MIAYKLTDANMQTHNNTQWVLNKWKQTSGDGNLCSKGWLHYYSDAKLALFLNPIHAAFDAPRLFEIEVQGKIKEDRGLKYGCTKMRLVKELPFIKPTTEQCIKFGILCALEVCKDATFVQWATNWLNGTDRSKKTARAAAWAADAGAAAKAVYWAARAAAAAWAAGGAAWAAAANDAHWAAGAAAWAAGAAGGTLDLAKIAHKAMEEN